MEKKIREYIEQHHILDGVNSVVLAVSGGPDSMALAHLLPRLYPGLRYTVAHVHHGLRDAADADETMVSAFCQERGLLCVVHHCDIGKLAKEEKCGIEETGRRERYRFFRSLKADRILTAHHLDDNAETVLLHLIRGSGLKGVGGMRPLSGDLGRPFLCVRKGTLLDYCDEHKIPYRIDESNEDKTFSRNRLRADVLPVLEEIRSGAVENICRASSLLREEERFLNALSKRSYDDLVHRNGNEIVLDRKGLHDLDPVIARRVLRLAAGEGGADVDREKTERALNLLTGKAMPFNDRLWLYNDGTKLVFSEKRGEKEKRRPLSVPYEGTINAEDYGMILTSKRTKERIKGNVKHTACIDVDLFTADPKGLTLRNREKGDYVCIDGGHVKKLSDFFIDAKIPAVDRDDLVLLAYGQRVLWIIGQRIFAAAGNENIVFHVE